MYEQENEQALNNLGNAGSTDYVHARNTLCINPSPQQNQQFDQLAHRGLIRKYNTNVNPRLLVVEHDTADRAQFEQCIRNCNYGNYTIEYSD